MHIAVTQSLFAWEELEDSPSLRTLGELLGLLPDGKLLASSRQTRGKGRDDYPAHVLWGVVVLSIACRHADMEACLAELRRNASLCRLLGIETTAQIPNGSANADAQVFEGVGDRRGSCLLILFIPFVPSSSAEEQTG